MDELRGSIARACEAWVLADPSDRRAMEDLRRRLESIAEGASRAGPEALRGAAAAALQAAAELAGGALADGGTTERNLEAALSALQAASEQPAEARGHASSSSPAAPVAAPAQGPDAAAERRAGPAAAEPPCDPSLRGDFILEAGEHLDVASMGLLSLERNPDDAEALAATFRAFHNIKGAAAFIGMDSASAFAHDVEDLLDRVRSKALALTGSIIDVVFEAIDALRRLVESGAAAPAETVARIRAAAQGRLELTPVRPDALGQLIGDALIAAGAATPRDVHEALLQAAQPPAPKKLGDILAESGVVSRRVIDATLDLQRRHSSAPPLGELLVQTGAATPRDVQAALDRQSRPPAPPTVGEILVHEGKASAQAVAQALRRQRSAAPPAPEPVPPRVGVRVDAERLDRLVDAIGELVIAESMVGQAVRSRRGEDPQLDGRLQELDKITRELQAMATALRMVPLRTLFYRMARLARDLARKAGKPLAFQMDGEETELDKSVVERIADPLVHLIRNAVDHGLEERAEDRVRAGKAERGAVTLRAYHKGGNLFVEVADDGRGLDREAIRAKARAARLDADVDALTEREVDDLIFLPGFSTAKAVSDVSGRGVGLDVVRRTVDALRGQVDVRSERGRGTTFTLRLPLTLAIIDGMVVRVGPERYVIPTLSIVRLVRPAPNQIETVLGRGELLRVLGELIPVFRLGDLFDRRDAEREPGRAVLVVVEDAGKQTALMVDELLGQNQIVIKGLGDALAGAVGLSGGAIMPDGTVGLVLDVCGLARMAHGFAPNAPPRAGPDGGGASVAEGLVPRAEGAEKEVGP